jgi:hypothetical protein
MNRTLSILLFLFATLIGQAQTYFYLDQIAVQPANPTTADNVSLSLIGNLSDGGAYIQTALADVSGGTVSITLVAMSNGGITVLVPHTEVIELGQLPAGTYTIDFTDASTGILDGAPLAQHTFTVSGPVFPCEDLTIDVQWAYFSDTAIVVHVQHNTVEQFDYPNFILYDAQGDLLALETVTYFAIAQDSWHTLRLMDDVEAPVGPFEGRLELWTGFTTTLACTWEQTFDLCPNTSCVAVYPSLGNFGGALPIGTFNWTIFNDGGDVANGQFVLTADVQQDMDTICLTPGNYGMNVSPLSPPTGGAPMYYVAGPGLTSTELWPVVWSLPVELSFVLLPYCVETPQGIADDKAPGLIVSTTPGGLWVHTVDGRKLGTLQLLDAQGRPVQATTATTDRHFLAVGTPGVYVLRTGDRTVKVVAGME